MSTRTAPIDTVTIDNNLMSGGGYTVYCGAEGPTPNSRFTRQPDLPGVLRPRRLLGPMTNCDVDVNSGNIWDDTGAPVE